ncbi:hypothetical protein FB565_007116 [Actinoplanes lutulentus]|uniref:B12 binding protein n=1 Tax=Actinoplanes lutulentus TaxID=1287878 RepID=A0A327ZAV7_9ACTN|nr:hypothetical protein [Actinoplanes lutulentus]MBB2947348.1 hypothetical protein [Actinoplanes lutulentus]RAK36623.1 hypothetical protein B0I29_108213 [Actinoplanes lutulentus]
MIARCWPVLCPDPDDQQSAAVRDLLRAVRRLDDGAALDTVEPAIAEHGVLCTWERLIRPVWAALGCGTDPSAAERLFSRSMFQALAVVRQPWSATGPQVLLACADEEHQNLPVDVLTAALAEHGISGCGLGPRVPPRAVAAAAHRLNPVVVVIWSQTRDTADPVQIRSLSMDCPDPAVIAAGPGWITTAPTRLAAFSVDVTATVSRTLALLGNPRAQPIPGHGYAAAS